MKISFEILENFLPLWENKKARYIILMGGRGAGRSTAASQYALSNLPASNYFRCAIMRAVSSNIRHTIWKEIIDKIDEQKIRPALHITENDMAITYGANSIQAHGFRASSGSNSAKLKSLANYNTVIIEEAEEIGEHEFMVLDDSLRTVKGDIRIVLCLNSPAKSHWIIKRWFDLDSSEKDGYYIPKLKKEYENDVCFIGGNYQVNISNLDRHTIQRYEGYKTLKPDYYWQVIKGYVPEVVRGRIYRGWTQVEAVPEGARLIRFGVDWGWYPDPVSVIALYYYNGEYIVDEIIHGTELEDSIICSKIKEVEGWKETLAICGADEPKSIEILRKAGIKAERFDNGPGSVDFRIKTTATKRIAVTSRSKNVWTGYSVYRWHEDKDGHPTGVPDHEGSDSMDAISYAVTSVVGNPEDNGKPKQYRPKW